MMKHFLKKGLMATAALGLIFTLIPAQPAQARSKKHYEPSKATYEYKDDNGKWVKESVTRYKYNKKGLVSQEITTSYSRDTDENGKTKVTKSTEKTTYKYNKRGLHTRIRAYDSKGKLYYQAKYTYKGRDIKSVTSKYRGGKSYKTVNSYNKHGFSKIRHYENNKLVSTQKYVYKGKKLKKIVTTDSKGKQTNVTTYKYKGSRLIQSVDKDSDGSRMTDTFNKKGHLKTSVYKSSDGSVYTHSYTYNKKGYEKKDVYTAAFSDGSKEKETTTYTYEFFKKKYLTQRTTKAKSSYGYTSWRRVTYSGWKKR